MFVLQFVSLLEACGRGFIMQVCAGELDRSGWWSFGGIRLRVGSDVASVYSRWHYGFLAAAPPPDLFVYHNPFDLCAHDLPCPPDKQALDPPPRPTDRGRSLFKTTSLARRTTAIPIPLPSAPSVSAVLAGIGQESFGGRMWWITRERGRRNRKVSMSVLTSFIPPRSCPRLTSDSRYSLLHIPQAEEFRRVVVLRLERL